MNGEVLKLILDRLDRMDADRAAARQEAKDERAEMVGLIREQNGRIGRLELWRHGFEVIRQSRSWRFTTLIAVAVGVTVSVSGTLIAIAINQTT